MCSSNGIYYVKSIWKFAFQKIRTKPTLMVIKSYTLSTILDRLNFIMLFKWMLVFFAREDSNLGIVKRVNIIYSVKRLNIY